MTFEPRGSIGTFLRFCGGSLVVGGGLTALLNLVLTPLLPVDAGSAAVATSTAYGIRMPLAALAVALTTVGCVGLYLAQAHRLRFGVIAFLLAGAGGLMTFCAEAVQATLIRDLAFQVPEVLESLEDAGQLGRYDIGFAIALATFAIGWLAVAGVTLRTGMLGSRGPLTLLAGTFLVPILGALVPGVWGAVVGSAVVGAGWLLLGLDLYRVAPAT